jgi:formylglycine-generating enzyme required for sulfatase activity
MKLSVLLICLAIFAGVSPIAATEDANPPSLPSQKRVALVIGNAAYGSASLKNPVNDARAMATALRGLGFDVIERENLTKAAFERVVLEFGRALSPQAVGLVYFAGHGLQAGGKNYLVPVDVSPEEVSAQAVPLLMIDADNVIAQMTAACARINLVILDACRSTPLDRRFRSGIGAGLAQMAAPTGTLIAYASAPGQVASDGSGEHGLYTQELLEAMRAPGLSVEEVFKRVRTAVRLASANAQTPWESSSLEGDFYFGTPPVQMMAAEETEISRLRAELDAMRQPANAYPPLKQAAALEVAPLPQSLWEAPGTKFRDCTDCPQMVVIPAGAYVMGSPDNEDGRYDTEGPQHRVDIPRAFALSLYHVTRDDYGTFVRDTKRSSTAGCGVWLGSRWATDPSKDWRNPGFTQTEHDPVVCVSWDDAQAYVQWLNKRARRENRHRGPYRLPTEAEWEYAARSGVAASTAWGEAAAGCRSANGADLAAKRVNPTWTVAPCDDGYAQTSPVGSFAPNAFGLYDMAGNAWQWLQDCWHESYLGAPADGTAWTSGECGRRVDRGGSWYDQPRSLRTAVRYGVAPDTRDYNLGFRVARDLD